MAKLTERAVLAHLAALAYADGFARGADPSRTRRRHVVDSATHHHWLRGYEDGRAAAVAARDVYLEVQLAASASNDGGAS